VKHGTHDIEAPPEALLDPDPVSWLAWADMDEWLEAHPCDCESLCECDSGDPPDD
jgi:hypothetical protein